MDYYIGDILLLPYGFATIDTLLCDGSSIAISVYEALFSLIGNTYGSNENNFNIPNMQGLEPIPGMAYYIVTVGIYPTQG
jgi:microcystin-dependent protein